jgi:hypothetical protein
MLSEAITTVKKSNRFMYYLMPLSFRWTIPFNKIFFSFQTILICVAQHLETLPSGLRN